MDNTKKTVLITEAQQRMDKALDIIRGDLSTIRTGRATPSLVEEVVVNAYDGTTKMNLSEMATISVADAKTLVIQPFDQTQIEAISKGILDSKINLVPVVDGQIIRLTVPALTQERREEYIKLAKAKTEAGKVMIRQIRHDAMAKVKNAEEDKELNEDEKFFLEKQIQDLTDKIMEEIEEMWKKKEEELRKV